MSTTKDESSELHQRNPENPPPAVDEEGEELLDINPMKKTCSYCKSEVVTYVEHETSPIFYAVLLISMLAFGWMFLILTPFAYILLKDAVHRCSRCLNEIGTRASFSLPSLKQEIFVIQLGKCSVVISRTIGLTIFGILSVIFLYFSWFYNWETTQHRQVIEGIPVSATWEEYMKDCGSNVMLTNNLRANTIFKRKYRNNIVNWSGYFIDKKEVEGFSFVESSHSLNVLIKMEPSETEFEPDIVLSFSGSSHEEYKNVLNSLQNGDQINFSAIFASIGDEFNENHLHAKSIVKTGLTKNLPDIVITDSKLPSSLPETMFVKQK